MKSITLAALAALACAPGLAWPRPAGQRRRQMTFFVTSANPGKGGDLGGLAGADAHCQALATPSAPATAPGAPISAPRAPMR